MYQCIICGSNAYKQVSLKTRDSDSMVVSCDACGHVQLNQKPSADFYDNNQQLKRIYDEINIEKLQNKSAFDTNRRMKFIEEHYAKNQTFLEVGIGYGFLMKALLDAGYNVEGIEVGSERRTIAQELTNGYVYSQDLCDSENNEIQKQYDVVMLFQVFEHILEPKVFLRETMKLLRDGGELLIEVPHYGDYMLTVSEPYKAFYFQEAHQSYYTYDVLHQLLTKEGFKGIEAHYVQRYSIENMMHWRLMGKPQIENPAYIVSNEMKDLDDVYKDFLRQRKMTDTLIVRAKK